VYRPIFILVTYLLSKCRSRIDVDIDIAIFRQYRIDIISKSNEWYWSISALLTPANFFVELERDFDWSLEFVYSDSEIARLANARQKNRWNDEMLRGTVIVQKPTVD